MSVAFQTTNTNRIQLPAMWIYNTPDPATWTTSLPAVKEEEDDSTSSSIGNNSDADKDDSDHDPDPEVQSKDNGPNFNDLEKLLPIKRGISTFYAGKSKSYGSLADAVSVPSIQDIVKPDDAYTRKRKNMIAHHVLLAKHRQSTPPPDETGISKRPARNNSSNSTGSSATSLSRPPLPNGRKVSTNESSDSSSRLYMSSPWRSLSLSDLQHASSFSNKGNEVDGH